MRRYKTTSKVLKATIKANKVKTKRVQKKFKWAISELKRLNIKITAHQISKITGMSRNTAIKYLKEINLTDYYVASWSGGKDSTFMINELLKRGERIDEVIFADTGYEFPQMYSYIEKMESYWKEKYPNIKISKLNWGEGKTIWRKWAEGTRTKGADEGKVRGFPYSLGMDWCTRELKIKPVENYLKKFGYGFIYYYIGIAYDEPKRVKTNGELYPLVKWKITEREIAESLLREGLHNPLYNHFARTGCYLCPKQSIKALYRLWKHYPNEWKNLELLQKHYQELNSATHLIRNMTIDQMIEKFKDFEISGEPTTYLDENEIGCFCK